MATLKDSISRGAQRAAQSAERKHTIEQPKDDLYERLKTAYSSMPAETRRQYAQTVQRRMRDETATFSSAYDALIDTYNSRAGQKGYMSSKDAQSYRATIDRRASSMLERADKYDKLMDLFGDDMDEEFKNNYAQSMNATRYGISQMRRGAKDIEDYYSQFKDKGEYMGYQIAAPLDEAAKPNAAARDTAEKMREQFAAPAPEEHEKKSKVLNYLEAIDKGGKSGLWQGAVQGPMDAAASWLGYKISSDETDTVTGTPGIKDTIRNGKDMYDRLGEIWGNYIPGDGSLGQNIKDTGAAAADLAEKQFGNLPIAKQIEFNQRYGDKLKNIWGDYQPGNGELGQNIKDTVFSGYEPDDGSDRRGRGCGGHQTSGRKKHKPPFVGC